MMTDALRQLVEQEAAAQCGLKPFMPGETTIPASGKRFGPEEFVAMVDAVMDGWWTEGRWTKQFEETFAAAVGRTFCATVNSGSSANLLAVAALTSYRLGERRLKKGDEVITVAAGFPTTILPLVQQGLVPVFIDIALPSYNATLEAIQAAYSPKVKAVMIAHTLGNPFPVEEVAAWCKEKGIWLVEDCCDALGGTYRGKMLGTFGDVATFSFYPAHQITMGEGGAVVTSDALVNKCVRAFRDWGRDCWCAPGADNTCGIRFEWKLGDLPKGYDHKYIYSEPGYNLKITDTQAALGCIQLTRLPEFVAARRKNHAALVEALRPVEKYLQLPEPTPGAEPCWFGFLLTVRDGVPFTRAELVSHLQTKKIGTRYLFAGNILRQPVFKNYDFPHRIVGDLAVSDVVTSNTFWIGCHPSVTAEMVAYMAATIRAFCESRAV
jgi:CDP-6-deoxy-D-xylo-4-hexulose-3-dehydrase